MQLTPRRDRPSIPASPRFDALARGARFRDRIALRVKASPEAIFDAVRHVTLADMKLARMLGELRYLPGRLTGHPPASDRDRPFLSILEEGGTLLLADDAPQEIILGSAGRLHQVVDQTPVRFTSADAFHAFDAPEFEKLFMSLRVTPSTRPGEQLLVLEHATLPLSGEAERKFRGYWRVIRPTGAFVSRQLLKAIRARAEAASRGHAPRPAASRSRRVVRWMAAAGAAAAGAYVGYVALTWLRYGRPAPARADEHDDRLDIFMPVYDVVDRHRQRVNAPAAATLEAARTMALSSLPAVHAIIRAREVLLGAKQVGREGPTELVPEMLSLGWGLLDEIPGREIVMGAVTKPWEANVTFRAIPREAFAAFDEPDYVKIAWTLRADPVDATRSVFRTETRATATDAGARAKFRLYWACLSPGIRIIRRAALRPVAREAERHASAGATHSR
jgi:hypothetical protein